MFGFAHYEQELGIVWNCTDRPAGPAITLVCNDCAASRDLYYFEVSFVDRPPLYAVTSGELGKLLTAVCDCTVLCNRAVIACGS